MKHNVKIIITVISVVVVVFLVCFALWSIGTEKTEYDTKNIYDSEDFKKIQQEVLGDLKVIVKQPYSNNLFKYYLQRTGFYNKYVIILLDNDNSYYLLYNGNRYLLLKKEGDYYNLPSKQTQAQKTQTQNPQETTPQEETTV